MSLGLPQKFEHMHPERRQSPRFDMPGPVFVVETGKTSEIGKVRDISVNGCFIDSNEEVAPDWKLRLQFRIGAEFEMIGTVRRKEPTGFAVQFEGRPLD